MCIYIKNYIINNNIEQHNIDNKINIIYSHQKLIITNVFFLTGK